MSAELIGILSVGVALGGLSVTLGGLLLASVKGLREDMNASVKSLREDMDKRFAALEGRFDALDRRVAALEQRMARLEGVLDGLREALFGRSREKVSE